MIFSEGVYSLINNLLKKMYPWVVHDEVNDNKNRKGGFLRPWSLTSIGRGSKLMVLFCWYICFWEGFKKTRAFSAWDPCLRIIVLLLIHISALPCTASCSAVNPCMIRAGKGVIYNICRLMAPFPSFPRRRCYIGLVPKGNHRPLLISLPQKGLIAVADRGCRSIPAPSWFSPDKGDGNTPFPHYLAYEISPIYAMPVNIFL